jgi:D-alanine-D-alanine ligase
VVNCGTQLLTHGSHGYSSGGYRDSCADLAYALHLELGQVIKLITPTTMPEPSVDADWSFGDHKETILEVITKHHANVLWANTNVHSTHPLLEVAKQYPDVLMVGQDPRQLDKYDDKAWANRWLQSQPGLDGSFPTTWIVSRETPEVLNDIPLPVIIKPVRGRGSQGVALCHSQDQLEQQAQKLWETGSRVVIEEFCSGEEITVAVLPPGTYDEPVGFKDKHWALPVVRRLNHVDDIMPYSGDVPVTANSCLVPLEEAAADPEYEKVQKRCELIGQALGTFATIRLDARRRGRAKSGLCYFVLLEVPGPGLITICREGGRVCVVRY